MSCVRACVRAMRCEAVCEDDFLPPCNVLAPSATPPVDRGVCGRADEGFSRALIAGILRKILFFVCCFQLLVVFKDFASAAVLNCCNCSYIKILLVSGS